MLLRYMYKKTTEKQILLGRMNYTVVNDYLTVMSTNAAWNRPALPPATIIAARHGSLI